MRFFERLIYNKNRLIFIFAGIVVLIIGFILNRDSILEPVDSGPGIGPTPTPYQTLRDIGFGNPGNIEPISDLTFNDPLRVPGTIRTFELLPGHPDLFSRDGMAAIASQIGFTGGAENYILANSYLYREDEKRLTIQPHQGIITFTSVLELLEPASIPIDAGSARDRTRNFVRELQFDNPLIVWSESEISTWAIENDSAYISSGITNNGFFEITVPLKINNLEIKLPTTLKVQVHANGDIIGANLWYPHLNLQEDDQIDIIDFASATGRARRGEGVYVGNYTAIQNMTTLTFESSTLAYVVSNEFINAPKVQENNFFLIPVYVFSNADVQLYVSALR